MPYCTMPMAAAAAANDTSTVISVEPRLPIASRYVTGTIDSRTSCLQSARLARGSGENAAETIVSPA